MENKSETLEAVWVKPDTKQALLREKHKRSVEKSKTVTFDQLVRELLGLNK